MKTKIIIILISIILSSSLAVFLTWGYAVRTHAVGCNIVLPGLPGYYCLTLDKDGNKVYENNKYKIYIK